MIKITPQYLKQRLRYEPETGNLIWLHSDEKGANWNSRCAGKVAGTINDRGYRKISINGKDMAAHRIAFAIYYGLLPENEIDHINGDKDDNRIENLRAVTRIQNASNRRKNDKNKSGYKGVYYEERTGMFRAQINFGKEKKHLGRYLTAIEAYAAYCNASLKFHGEFGRTT
jgi:hypothetical protein